MPAWFDVNAASGSYRVAIQPGLWEEALGKLRDRVVIADEYFAPQATAAGAHVIALQAAESAKSLDRIPAIVEELRALGFSRDAVLLAVGGGIVQDVAGFVASVYMRGVAWTYFPTTLLAMTDSCVGGKSSINVGPYKNIVGTFHPPRKIDIDPVLIDTLSAEQKVAGLCEAAKICFCSGPDDFDAYCALRPTVRSAGVALADVLQISLKAKIRFIEIDEFDRGERLLLNFGHTFGHAIESASHFRISHGVAVGLGILAALNLSRQLGKPFSARGRTGILQSHIEDLLRRFAPLPALLEGITVADLMNAFGSDKKHDRQNFAVIVVAADRVERLILPRSSATSAMIEASFSGILAQFRAAVAPIAGGC